MRAAVIRAYGDVPIVDAFAEPAPSPGQVVVRVTAAGLNPADVGIASGGFALRHPPPPFVIGLDGIGTLPDGRRVYFRSPPMPYGAVAELAPVAAVDALPLPDGLDDGLAAALAVPGPTAWLALELRARLVPGETVLVLGAGGGVGQAAVQVARLLGAGRVVAAARGKTSLARARAQGADATVRMGAAADLPGALRAAAPGGYDVVLDLAWGEAIQAAIDVANVGARVVQVGNLAGPAAQLSAPSFRNKLIAIIGHTNILTPDEAVREAVSQVMQHAARGELTMELERVPLDGLADAWARLKAGASRKLVMTL
jgi:NADPH2:quinone reductase